MKKILLSVATIAFVGTAVAGLTGAFYKDVETSTGNTFTAGGLELKVDSESHYNNMICTDIDGDGLGDEWQPEPDFIPGPGHYPPAGSPCNGTWAEADLVEGIHKFFYFTDLKPGDSGEDTISLHVYENDAWGQFIIDGIIDQDNTCTGPEIKVEDETGTICVDPNGDGEIDNYLTFTGWLDQGTTPGFQCGEPGLVDPCIDPEEGDNIYQPEEGPYFWDHELISNLGPFELSEVFGAAYEVYCVDAAGVPLYDPSGDNDYGYCHGFADDGRMVKSTTYYFGLEWDFPLETDNDAQTDEYTADMTFEVEQHRNNPTPFAP